VSGALAERVFVEKAIDVGFDAVEVVERRQFGVEDAALYPLFTPDLIALMRQLLSARQRAEVAVAITLTASKRDV
jgi:hypothetical protein